MADLTRKAMGGSTETGDQAAEAGGQEEEEEEAVARSEQTDPEVAAAVVLGETGRAGTK